MISFWLEVARAHPEWRDIALRNVIASIRTRALSAADADMLIECVEKLAAGKELAAAFAPFVIPIVAPKRGRPVGTGKRRTALVDGHVPDDDDIAFMVQQLIERTGCPPAAAHDVVAQFLGVSQKTVANIWGKSR